MKATTRVGPSAWSGLVVRYTDSRNYYYLMNGPNNTLQIRKIVNGVFGPIASTPFTLALGSTYRLRLEAVGTRVRAFVDGRQVLDVRDTSHAQGKAGLAMWKTNADYDNVVISTSPYTTLHADSFSGTDEENASPPWETSPANVWSRVTTSAGATVFRQSLASGDARAVHGAHGRPDRDGRHPPANLPHGWHGLGRIDGAVRRRRHLLLRLVDRLQHGVVASVDRSRPIRSSTRPRSQ